MKVGFTGTRKGMDEHQMMKVVDELQLIKLEYVRRPRDEKLEFHHGDCNGADAEAHRIARTLGYWTVVHPPIDEKERAFCDAHEIKKAYTYLARNRMMVDEVDYMIGAPPTVEPQEKGGTWYTIGYARKTQKPIKVIAPRERAKLSA